jgi:phage gp29-like protein
MNVIGWLKGVFGKAEARAANDLVALPHLSLQNQRIGGNLTPLDVSRIMANADAGQMWQLCDLADESRQRDCHLQSILGTREMGVAGLPWQVTAAGKGKKKRDRKIAEFVTGVLQNFGADDPSPRPRDLYSLICHLASATYYGYAVAQLFWVKRNGKIVVVGAEAIRARRFIYDQEDGLLKFCEPSSSSSEAIDLLAVYPHRFVQYEPRINGGGPTREGLMRVLLWSALFRNWSIRDWLQLAELAWKPWRIGYYADGATASDKSALRQALQYLTTVGAALLPERTNLKVEWPKASGKGGDGQHKTLCDFMAAEMSKATLGATLTVAQGNVGTQALGNVHNEVRKDIREFDAKGIASIIRRQIIAPLVRMNFGNDVDIPDFAFITEDSVDLDAHSRAILNYRKAGLRIAAQGVRDVAGFPEPKEGEELLGEDDSVDVDVDADIAAQDAAKEEAKALAA